MSEQKTETLPLSTAASHLLEECRMVLPGIQALFGFQLIAVFSNGFSIKLSDGEQMLHLCALALVAASVSLVMAPAAYHRQTSATHISEEFIRLASRLLLWSMPPLMFGIGIDFYLVARVILYDSTLSLFIAVILVALFSFLWFLLPRLKEHSAQLLLRDQ